MDDYRARTWDPLPYFEVVHPVRDEREGQNIMAAYEAGKAEGLRHHRGAVDAERERIVALIRREASETFDGQLEHELRVLADRIAAGGR